MGQLSFQNNLIFSFTHTHNLFPTCNTIVLSCILYNPILLPQLPSLHLVLQHSGPAPIIIAKSGVTKPHIVDIHVGGANPELADVLIKGVALKPHRAEEGNCGELVVKYRFSVNDPDT